MQHSRIVQTACRRLPSHSAATGIDTSSACVLQAQFESELWRARADLGPGQAGTSGANAALFGRTVTCTEVRPAVAAPWMQTRTKTRHRCEWSAPRLNLPTDLAIVHDHQMFTARGMAPDSWRSCEIHSPAVPDFSAAGGLSSPGSWSLPDGAISGGYAFVGGSSSTSAQPAGSGAPAALPPPLLPYVAPAAGRSSAGTPVGWGVPQGNGQLPGTLLQSDDSTRQQPLVSYGSAAGQPLLLPQQQVRQQAFLLCRLIHEGIQHFVTSTWHARLRTATYAHVLILRTASGSHHGTRDAESDLPTERRVTPAAASDSVPQEQLGAA